jgi:8-oxo-dGTP pyrophosphatase MutT (NUDIX family)
MSSFADEIAGRLAAREPRIVPDPVERRAAVTLVFKPGEDGPQGLFVHRAEAEGDPWSGHMALPGGRADPDDADLIATARRELEEETGLTLARDAFLGRLHDVWPRSQELPSIAVTPFVAWHEDPGEVLLNIEVQGHVWIPLHVLGDPRHRSELRLERRGEVRVYPTIEYQDHTIWGLTLSIVDGFLRLTAC